MLQLQKPLHFHLFHKVFAVFSKNRSPKTGPPPPFSRKKGGFLL